MIKDAARLYFNVGDRIADVTYGKGAFWREIDHALYNFSFSDLKLNNIDFRNLPYDDEVFDHTVIDPPYARIQLLQGMVDCYKTTRHVKHTDIIELYESGLKELKRVTKPGGFILCKCQDEIEGGRQKYSHIEIFNIANELGLYAKDLFVLKNTRNPKHNYPQKHARKNHSYLWVFQKVS